MPLAPLSNPPIHLRSRPGAILGLIALLLGPLPELRAELPWSRLDAVFPAGGKAGSTVEVRLFGADLETTTELRFSHPGITGKRKPGSPPADHLFEVTIAPDVSAQMYDVSARGPLGLSTIRTFCVGQRGESSEVEPNDQPAQATPATVDTVLNGRIGRPTDVDSYQFRAAPGQRVIADCFARRIDSPLLPVLEILDSRGRRVAFDRAGRTSDALIVFDPPTAGDFVLRIYDQSYRGGDEFVYRLQLHTGPLSLAVLPDAGLAGEKQSLDLLGLNLPGETTAGGRWRRFDLQRKALAVEFPRDGLQYDRNLPVTPIEAALDSFSTPVAGDASPLSARLHFAQVAPQREQEPNDSPSAAQRLMVPAEIAGQFATVGDVDRFEIEVKKGEPLWIEVFAERIGSPVDATMSLDFIPAGSETASRIAQVDDQPAAPLPLAFENPTDDPSTRFDPTADGRCVITIRDLYGQNRGESLMTYRLRVTRPDPDFRVVALPTWRGAGALAATTLRRGDARIYTVLALRQQAFPGRFQSPRPIWAAGCSPREPPFPKGSRRLRSLFAPG